ncbi:hypothetical protein ABID19_006056 [Mesorhizobium robiniae]|uniref:Uncharacterized protein n=1 Tax=Mesorhizobium robiniae TaxID=559315 RepID=A0ABV2GXG8_9HYPH
MEPLHDIAEGDLLRPSTDLQPRDPGVFTCF